MTASLADLIAYSAQLAILTVAGTAALAVLRVRAPRPGLRLWQVLLVAALLLPLTQPRPQTVVPTSRVAIPTVQVNVEADTSVTDGSAAWTLPAVLTVVLIAGVAMRLAWLVLGLVRLALLRRRSRPCNVGCAEALQDQLCARADIRLSTEVDSPVTLGAGRPTVLLPERFPALAADVQEAALCHELLHVRRRDWAHTIGEEALCALFWFHPAVRFLVSRIRLMREAVVDEEVITLTGSKRAYVQALLAFAEPPPRRIYGATPFLRVHSLAHRLSLLSKEAHMSRRHLATAVASLLLIVAATTRVGAALFPLSPVITVEPARQAPIRVGGNVKAPAKLKHVAPVYPEAARDAKIKGVVILETVINEEGRVADVQVLRGIDQLTEAAMDAVRQWEWEPTHLNGAPVPVIMTVTVNFTLDDDERPAAATPPPQTAPAPGTPIRVGSTIGAPTKLKHVAPVYPPDAKAAGISGVVIVEATIDAEGKVSSTKVLRGIEQLNDAAVEAVSQWEFQPVLLNGAPVPVIVTLTVNFTLDDFGGLRRVHDVRPVYPLGVKHGTSSRVRVSFDVDALGAVTNLRVVEGAEPFATAVITAIQQWRYDPPAKPPLRVNTTITMRPPGGATGSPVRPGIDVRLGEGTGAGQGSGIGAGQGSGIGAGQGSGTGVDFTGQPISVDFKQADIRDVVSFIARAQGKNVVVDPVVSGKVDLSMKDVPWDQVLDFVVRSAQARWTVEGNVIHVLPARTLIK